MDTADPDERYKVSDPSILFVDTWADEIAAVCAACGAPLDGAAPTCDACGKPTERCPGSCSSCGVTRCTGDARSDR